MTECDNFSVGVIIERGMDIALLQRAKFPIAIAPPAGHIDQHGIPELAAIAEVEEELGLVIARGGLLRTTIANRRVENRCRRPGGDYHYWSVFRATAYSGVLRSSLDETRGAGWYNSDQLQELADRTQAFSEGRVTPEQWEQEPGLEAVWVDFMTELGYLA